MRLWICGSTLSLVAAGNLAASSGAGELPETKSTNAPSQTNATVGINRPPSTAQMVPFRGRVTAVDKASGLVTLLSDRGTLKVLVATNTLARRTGKRVTIEDIAPGDSAGGLGRYQTNGTVRAFSLQLGARPPGDGNTKRIGEKPPTE